MVSSTYDISARRRRRTRLSCLSCCAALILVMTGCPSQEERDKEDDRRFGGVISNPQESPQFQAFMGKLRKAVQNRDYDMMVRMMSPEFGYDLNAPTDGSLLAIQYWNQYGLWPELERVLNSQFYKKGQFVVAPPEFADMTEEKPYTGYRAGMIETQNGWRFAYFVSDESHFSPGSAPAPSGPAPETYIGDTAPVDELTLPSNQLPPPGGGGPRVLANPSGMEYSGAPMPRPQVPTSGTLRPPISE